MNEVAPIFLLSGVLVTLGIILKSRHDKKIGYFNARQNLDSKYRIAIENISAIIRKNVNVPRDILVMIQTAAEDNAKIKTYNYFIEKNRKNYTIDLIFLGILIFMGVGWIIINKHFEQHDFIDTIMYIVMVSSTLYSILSLVGEPDPLKI